MALWGEVRQLTRRVGDLEHDFVRMRQQCNRNVEDALFERDGLQGRPDLTASQILKARNSSTS